MRKIISVLHLLIIFLILLSPLILYARAGGGHSFGGGGSHSSHGFGGRSRGGGDGPGLIYLIMLLIEYPHIGLPIVAGGILFFYIMGKRYNNYRIESTIRRAGGLSLEQEKRLIEENLGILRQSDPEFSVERFIKRAKNAFVIIQKAWSEQDLTPIIPFVSNGVLSRFSIQIDIQKKEGYRNRIENIDIAGAEIAGVASDNLYDRIDVRFVVSMDDEDVDLKTGKVLDTHDSSFVEYWTFLRRKGAKTRGGAGLIEGRCPNCGGDLKIVESGHCEYCKAFVFSGEYDWILTEITQEDEYSSIYIQDNIIGLDEMLKKDPSFNIAVIEDKVSYLFYRIYQANYYGDVKYIKAVAHPDFYKNLETAFNPQSEWYPSLKDAAVGAVETKRVLIDGSDGYDRVEVMIRWSAEFCERNRKTGDVRKESLPEIRTQLYTLVRRSDVKTKARFNFKTIPCRSCGAPIGFSAEDRCEYCDAVINDGSRDWVLYSVDIYRPYAFQSQFVGVVKDNSENKIMLSAMISAMLSDGVIDEREKEMLYSAAQNRGLSKNVVDQMIESAKKGELVAIPSNIEEARGMLASMARVALADGKISKEEYNLMLNFGAKYNYKKADIDVIINNQRRLLFNEARKFIKNTKVR